MNYYIIPSHFIKFSVYYEIVDGHPFAFIDKIIDIDICFDDLAKFLYFNRNSIQDDLNFQILELLKEEQNVF